MFREGPDTFKLSRHVMRATLSVRPKCSQRCVSLMESPLKPVLTLKHATRIWTKTHRKAAGKRPFPAMQLTVFVCHRAIRSSQTGTLQTGTLRIREKSTTKEEKGRKKAGPLWQKRATCQSSEECAPVFALKLKASVSKVPFCEPPTSQRAQRSNNSRFRARMKFLSESPTAALFSVGNSRRRAWNFRA